jgi:hypothetical protein
MAQITRDAQRSSENLRRKFKRKLSIGPVRLKRLRGILSNILSRCRESTAVVSSTPLLTCLRSLYQMFQSPDDTKAREPTTSAEVYVRSMASDRGLAFWEPRPLNAGERGTVPGDVGTLSAAGGFRKIFNIWADAEAVRGANLTSHRYEPPEMNIVTHEEALLPSEPITHGTTKAATQYTDGKCVVSFSLLCRLG